MDTIDRFKIEALGNMKQTVEHARRARSRRSKGYIARAEGVEQNRRLGTAADSSNPLTAIEG